MKLKSKAAIILILVTGFLTYLCSSSNLPVHKLPAPNLTGNLSIEEALQARRSVRNFKADKLQLSQVSQLLWAAQGINSSGGKLRTAPSAGALYPLETYIVIGEVEGITSGIYKYIPDKHELHQIADKDVRKQLSSAALGQRWVAEAPVSIVFSAVMDRTTSRYGDRGINYVYMEAGHAGQNLSLQVISLGLGTVAVGAFRDSDVKQILSLSGNEMPLYIFPVGKPQ